MVTSRYRWTFNGEHFNVSDSERVTQSSTDGTLMFNGLGPRHVGYYQCFADNDYGVAVSVKTNLRQAVLFDSNEENYLEVTITSADIFQLISRLRYFCPRFIFSHFIVVHERRQAKLRGIFSNTVINQACQGLGYSSLEYKKKTIKFNNRFYKTLFFSLSPNVTDVTLELIQKLKAI